MPFAHRVLAAALAGASLFSLTLPAGARAQPKTPELAQLVATWSKIADFEVTISAREVDGDQTQSRQFRYSYMRPDHAKIELLDGPNRGAIAVWNGGTQVVAYKRGVFSALRRTFHLHDKPVTSLRGNGLLTPELGATLRCFEAKESEMRTEPGPMLNGEETDMLVLEDSKGLRCPGDPPGDHAVTKDVLIVSRAKHLPLRRTRYIDASPVEEWNLSGLRINNGLSPRDFS